MFPEFSDFANCCEVDSAQSSQQHKKTQFNWEANEMCKFVDECNIDLVVWKHSKPIHWVWVGMAVIHYTEIEYLMLRKTMNKIVK